MLEDIIKKWDGEEVSAMDVYADVFHLGEHYIQREGERSNIPTANPIAYWKNKDSDKGHFRIMFEDTFEDVLKELQNADFAILNGLTYFGRRNVQNHASKMYAMIFDLDSIDDSTLNNFLSGAFGDWYPIPNYVIMSGHGVHLYYLFEEPIPLYPNIKAQLKAFKYALTERIWNGYTSNAEAPQMQGINQGFRVIGGKTKIDGVRVRAFRVNKHPFNLDQLGRWVPEDVRVDESKLFKESKITLAAAKEKYPVWYEKVIEKKQKKPNKWDIQAKVHGDNPIALYDWWLNKIHEGASFGHRYFNVMCLAIYGIKCDVPYEKVEKDALDLIPKLNNLKPEFPFTKADVYSALECYDERYYTFPLLDISKISGIPIQKNKRNGRTQEQHLKAARAVRDAVNENWRQGNGRKSKQQEVMLWQMGHPNGTKTECIKETGLSKPTVLKWWSTPEPKEMSDYDKMRLKRLLAYQEKLMELQNGKND